MNEYIKIVYDEEELKWFFDNVLPELSPTEVYFISLSARNKYLSKKEREFYALGRTEMFQKTIVRKREWEKFKRTVYKFECNEKGYTTKNDMPIPQKTMVCYININPSDTLVALKNFSDLLNEYNLEMASLLQSGGNKENFFNRLNKVDNNLLTYYQQATGKKHYIDIDFDLTMKNEGFINEISNYIESRGISTYFWLDTHSGYHLLVKKEEVKFNIQEVSNYAVSFATSNGFFNPDTDEVIVNKNAMIPVPGTLAGNYPIKILNKEIINAKNR